MNELSNSKSVLSVGDIGPAELLRDLGLEGELYLYRCGPIERCARVSLDALDEAIRHRGRALIFQIVEGENLLPVVFTQRPGIEHECVSLCFDYTEGIFLFTFYSRSEKGFYNMTPCDMRQQGFSLPVFARKQWQLLPL